ncbi:MAG: DUF6639 family protein [Hyphomicrobiaceae bacterium]
MIVEANAECTCGRLLLLQIRMPSLGSWHHLLLLLGARCRQIIATVLVVAVFPLFAGHGVRAEQRDNCVPHGIAVVDADLSELEAACNAVSDVVRYFSGTGFQVPTKVSVHFANLGGEGARGHSLAHGLFDPLRSQIVIYRASNVRPWGQSWSPKLVESFLRHEIVHTVIWDVMKANPKRLGREWHEFIAYAVQLDLMDADLRNRVLGAQTSVGPITDLSEVNEFSYGMNPEAFAVVAYKTYLARDGAVFVRQLLNGEIIPPVFSYPFAVQPHEVQR